MEMLDMRTKPCPIPVIEAKKVLREQSADGVTVTVDNLTAVENLEKMAKGYGFGFSVEEKSATEFSVVITKDGAEIPEAATAPEPVAQKERGGAFVVVIGRNTMGEGSEELGKILLKGFIYSLTELDRRPDSVIFFNSGAHMTADDSNALEDLRRLEDAGTQILTCGTCANFYGLEKRISVGSTTNMFGITERMAAADRLINL